MKSHFPQDLGTSGNKSSWAPCPQKAGDKTPRRGVAEQKHPRELSPGGREHPAALVPDVTEDTVFVATASLHFRWDFKTKI